MLPALKCHANFHPAQTMVVEVVGPSTVNYPAVSLLPDFRWMRGKLNPAGVDGVFSFACFPVSFLREEGGQAFHPLGWSLLPVKA